MRIIIRILAKRERVSNPTGPILVSANLTE